MELTRPVPYFVETPSPGPASTAPASTRDLLSHPTVPNASAPTVLAPSSVYINQHHHPSSASLHSVISSMNLPQFAQQSRQDSQGTPPPTNPIQQNSNVAPSGKVTPSPTEFQSQNGNHSSLAGMNHGYGLTMSQAQSQQQLLARTAQGASGAPAQSHVGGSSFQPGLNFQMGNMSQVVPNYYLSQQTQGYSHLMQNQFQQLQAQNHLLVGNNMQGNATQLHHAMTSGASGPHGQQKQPQHGNLCTPQQQQLHHQQLLQQQQQLSQPQPQPQLQPQPLQVNATTESKNGENNGVQSPQNNSNLIQCQTNPVSATSPSEQAHQQVNTPSANNSNLPSAPSPAMLFGQAAAAGSYPNYFFANPAVAAQGQQQQMMAAQNQFMGHLAPPLQQGVVPPHLMAFGGAANAAAAAGAFPPQPHHFMQKGITSQGVSNGLGNEKDVANINTSASPNFNVVQNAGVISSNELHKAQPQSSPDVSSHATATHNLPSPATTVCSQDSSNAGSRLGTSSNPLMKPTSSSFSAPTPTNNTQQVRPFQSSFESVINTVGHTANGLVMESTASKLSKRIKTSQSPQDEKKKKMTAREKNRIHSRNSRARKRDAILRIKEEHAHLQIYRIMMDAMVDMVSLHEMSDDAKLIYGNPSFVKKYAVSFDANSLQQAPSSFVQLIFDEDRGKFQECIKVVMSNDTQSPVLKLRILVQSGPPEMDGSRLYFNVETRIQAVAESSTILIVTRPISSQTEDVRLMPQVVRDYTRSTPDPRYFLPISAAGFVLTPTNPPPPNSTSPINTNNGNIVRSPTATAQDDLSYSACVGNP
eukprot:CAMPEP_0113330540 /NCGR_PEP_ID=MMETSP0010_2-20120614/21708_1 /TAXON_ID=216773 ORGANISM="Corethron hystrix, Strain 308" /NCGR_SAMPLE_ID=MMETSP0010_2 /ASSEMBLY_ACC=CAM_ASM_000155 /LENGTH=811 /DNA_ID=CAMNT_0000193143 /DNA_START=726 /DNA_END=3161 /DNA_ORIENTATION=- /assembly_acc=CAM_ASM_000155